MSATRPNPPHLRLVSSQDAPASQRVAAPFDDSELIASVRNGDPSMATAFHERVRPQIDRTIARLLGRGDRDHDDIAQVALIELVTTIHRFRGECSFDSWIATLIARVVYKKIRRRQIERRIFDQADPADHVLPAAPSSTSNASQRELIDRVLAHLQHIETTRAWAFVLHDVWGYDLREMAGIMEVSVAAAQSRLVRGRRDLHARLASDPELAQVLAEMEGVP